MITIVIPTLNAAESLTQCLTSHSSAWRTIICDGGSTDKTREIAQSHGALVVESAKGRGRQLHTGAKAATTDWLLFLHADTRLSANAARVIDHFIKNPENEHKAGYFRFLLDDKGEKARIWEKRVAWRCQKLALPYGDQGLLISREFYNQLGGYKNMPLMEDVDFIGRIKKQSGKKALVLLAADATTSAEKFQRDGYYKRSMRNLFCLLLFWVKVPPHLIAKLY